MEVPVEIYPRGSLVPVLFRKFTPSLQLTRGTCICQLNIQRAQLPPGMSHAKLKVAYGRTMQARFDWGDTIHWKFWDASAGRKEGKSICRHFFHFCKDRWLSRAPGCEVLMKHCYLWLCMNSWDFLPYECQFLSRLSLHCIKAARNWRIQSSCNCYRMM